MTPNPLWSRILRLLPQFRKAFSRHRTFLWFCCLTLATVLRADLLGVTSFARSLGGKSKIYDCLLGFFASGAVKLDVLSRIWAGILASHKMAVKVNGRILLVVDGIKAPKSGRQMPAVKKLFQHSSSNTKPAYITGHSCQNIAILLGSLTGVFAVPILTRILEGLSLVSMSGHLITRAKGNAVAYLPFQKTGKQKRGRPPQYGKKVSLKTLSKEHSAFVEAESPVYGEHGVNILYREVILLWKPLGKKVKFVIVKHPTRGKRGGAFYLMTTDLELDAMDLIYIYGLRFKIEVSFKAAIHSVGAFAYHFWTSSMKKRSRASGDQYVHREPEENVEKIKMKMNAYHVHLQIGNITQGMMQILALEMPQHVVALDFQYRRTVCELPTEATVAAALKSSAWIFDGMTDDPEQCVNQMQNAMNLARHVETGSGELGIFTGT